MRAVPLEIIKPRLKPGLCFHGPLGRRTGHARIHRRADALPAQAARKFVPWAAANYATVQCFGALHPSSQQEAKKR
jgi:hypothetical protein